MSYEDFLERIKTETLDKKTYYRSLLKFADRILMEIVTSSQSEAAAKLGMNPAKLSAIKPLLTIFAEECSHDQD